MYNICIYLLIFDGPLLLGPFTYYLFSSVIMLTITTGINKLESKQNFLVVSIQLN